jgi:hypothetical protein
MTKREPRDVTTGRMPRRAALLLLALPLVLLGSAAVFLAVESVTVQAQWFLAPEGAFFCTPTHIAALVLLLLALIVSVPPGFIIVNALLWNIPGIRNAMSRNRMRVEASFVEGNRSLIRIAIFSTIALLPIYLVAMGSMVCTSPSEIDYRANLLSSWHSYSLPQVVEVRPRCERSSRGSWTLGLDVEMSDGAIFDLAIAPSFSVNSTRLKALLRGRKSTERQIDRDCPTSLRALVAG